MKKDTLLHYDRIGLLRPERVDAQTGYRYYSARQLYTFDLIAALKRLGLPLGEIRSYLGRRSREDFLDLLRRQQEILAREQRRLESIASLLGESIRATEGAAALPSGTVRLERQAEAYYISTAAPKLSAYDERQYLLQVRPLLERARAHGSLAFPPGDILRREALAEGIVIEDAYFCRVKPEGGTEGLLRRPAGLYAVLYHQGNYESQYGAYRALYDWTQAQGHRVLGDLFAEDLLHYLSTDDPDSYLMRACIQVADEGEV